MNTVTTHSITPPTAPTSFVIFGATGDLAQRKLLPALFNLFTTGYLPKTFRIIGVARDHLSTAEWRRFVEGILVAAAKQPSVEKFTEFLTTLTYQQGLFEDGQAYLRLSEELIRIENKEFGKCSNKLFYLAVSPLFYSTIFTNLAHSGLTIPCGGEDGWTRILVEKPFGRDLDTAQELDRTLGLLFKEEQIFRIDHYLAKETLQNILAFRFSNSLFEPLWNSTYIDKVEIKVWEELGVGTRGAFYEDVGALRDVGQNHMLQMLALIAMEDPGAVTAAAIRSARAKVLTTLVPLGAQDVARDTVRAQYRGYREEQNVATLSNTETFFRIKAHLNNERWQGVPFYLESGKKMAENLVTVSLFFKERASCLIEPNDDQRYQNVLTFRIQPEEGISLVFWAKRPGFGMELEGKKLSFLYSDQDTSLSLPDAYEHVLFDCIRGDQTLFTSTEEVSAAWGYITPILTHWEKTPLLDYEPGSRGPVIHRRG